MTGRSLGVSPRRPGPSMVQHQGGWRSEPIGLVIHKSFNDMDLRRLLWPRPTKGGPGLSITGWSNKGFAINLREQRVARDFPIGTPEGYMNTLPGSVAWARTWLWNGPSHSSGRSVRKIGNQARRTPETPVRHPPGIPGSWGRDQTSPSPSSSCPPFLTVLPPARDAHPS